MQIRYTKSVSTLRDLIQAHTVRDLPDSEAVSYINAGVAVPVRDGIEIATAPPARETATSLPVPRKAGRPKKRSK